MRRVSALILFTLGYVVMAMVSPTAAAVPCVAVFALAGWLLVSQPARPRDGAEAIAHELLRR
jgi:hypothetical protein